MRSDRWAGWPLWTKISAFLAAYVLLVGVSYRIAWATGGIAPLWWPASGLALGVLIRTPTRVWPRLLAPLALVMVVLGLVGLPEPRQPPAAVGVVWALSDIVVPLTGAWLVRRFGEPPFAFQRPREVLVFLLGGVLAPSLLGTGIVLFGAAIWPGVPPDVSGWGPWWMGETLGILSIAPAVMTWRFPGDRLRSGRAGRIEAVALLAGVVLVGAVSFELPTPGLQVLLVAGATGPLLAWASIRFGPREASWATIVLAVIATARALAGTGPFAEAGLLPHERVFYCAGFFSLAMIMSLLVAAFAADRRRAEAWQRLLLEASTVLGGSAPLGGRLRRVTDLVSARLDADCELHVGAVSYGKTLKERSQSFPLFGCDGDLAIEPLRRSGRLGLAEVEASSLLASKISGACERDRLVREVEAHAGRNEESLALLDSVLRSAPVGIAILDRELRFLRINEAMAQINGISAEDHLGRRVLEVFSRKEGVALDEGLRRVLETGEPVVAAEVTGESLSRPGEQRTWSVTWFPVAVPGRPPHAVCAFTSDVTERKRQEDRLRASEERFRALAEGMSELIFTLDHPQMVPRKGAARWKAITGQSEADYQSERWLEVIHPDDREQVRSSMHDAARDGRPMRVTCRLKHRDGSFRHVESFAVPIRDANGTIREWIGAATDVTDRVRGEQERERALAEAQEAVQVREDFLSIASHELKTPLTPLSARLEMIQRQVEAGQPVDLASVQKARAALSRLTFLIGDLLDVARIRSARMATAQEPVSLSELVHEVADAFREQSKRHRFQLDLPEDPLWIKGERSRLTQVFDNLVDNAIKFSPEGGRIGIVLRAEGDQAHLSVSDEGIGIPAPDHADLFERFYRAHNVSTRSYGGLGLGLYISREIVELHGGRIWLESELGRGTTFHVTLPLMKGAEAAAQMH